MCRKREFDYQKVSDLPKRYAKRITAEILHIVVFTWCFYFTLDLVLYVIMADTANSSYYTWAFFPIPVLQLLSFAWLLCRHGEMHLQETYLVLHISCEDIFYCWAWKSERKLSIITFLSAHFWIFVYTCIVALRPQLLYADLTGPPVGMSSCSNDPIQIELAPYYMPYNPAGFFDTGEAYANDLTMVYCTMNQSWAGPVKDDWIYGFPIPVLGIANSYECPPPNQPFPDIPVRNNVNGNVDTTSCSNSSFQVYPSPVLGVQPPIIPGTNPYNLPFTLCPGNTAISVCVGGVDCANNYRQGAPKVICSQCLPYYRQQSGDITGPAGYSQCDTYSPTQIPPWFCGFCPGRGFGLFPNENYDQPTMLNNLIIASIIEGSYILMWFTLMCCFSCRIHPTIRTNQNKQYVYTEEDLSIISKKAIEY